MPEWLQAISVICSVFGIGISLYLIWDKKKWNRELKVKEMKDEISRLRTKVDEHTIVYDAIKEYMQDQLILSLESISKLGKRRN